MLSKLLKHEFKDTARIIPMFYLISLIFAGMVLSAKTLNIDWFKMTTSVVLLLLGIAVPIITFVVIAMRFYKNLYSNEGYLMLTLPVKPHLLLAAKGITAFVWMLLSFGVTTGAFYISMYGLGITGELSMVMNQLKAFEMEKVIYFLVPVIILATIYLLGQIYFAITMANRPAFHSLGGAASFLVFIATNLILQIAESIFTIFVPFSVEINLIGDIGISLTSKNMFGYLLESVKGVEPTTIVVGFGGYIFEIIMICILFYVTSRIMKNKVSLR